MTQSKNHLRLQRVTIQYTYLLFTLGISHGKI